MSLDFPPSLAAASTEPVILDGRPLDFATLTRIARRSTHVAADETALERVRAAREVLLGAIAAGRPVYGSNTGVGAMKDVSWSDAELDEFNTGLVRAHHFGTGVPFPTEVVRTAIAIRTNMALTGRVGCTTELIEAFLALLERDVVPVVRRTGSIGCADIGLMGQIGAVLTGVGEAMHGGERLSAAVALERAGLEPFKLAPRDSLAAVSTNSVAFAAAAPPMPSASCSRPASPPPAPSGPPAIRGRPWRMSAPSARRPSVPGSISTPWAGTGPTPPTCRIRSRCA